MSERINERINRETIDKATGAGGYKIVALTATVPTYQMLPTDTILSVTSTEADGTGIVYLPSMAEAVGKFYYIIAPTGATAGDISVCVKETATEITTYGDLDADNDHVMLWCSGQNWRVILNGVA